jgi:hypothetical protein
MEKVMTRGDIRMDNVLDGFKETLAPYAFHEETILDSLSIPAREVIVNIGEGAPIDEEKTNVPERDRISLPTLRKPAPPKEEDPKKITEVPATGLPKPSPQPSSPKTPAISEQTLIAAFEGWKMGIDLIPSSVKASIRYAARYAKPITEEIKAVLGEDYRLIDSPCQDGDSGLWALLFGHSPTVVCDKIDGSENSKSFLKVVLGFRAKVKKNTPTSNIGNPGTYTTPEQLELFAQCLGRPLAILRQGTDKNLRLIDFNDVSTKEWKHNPTREDGKRLEETYKNNGILLLLTENIDASGQTVRHYVTLVHRDRIEPLLSKESKASPGNASKKRSAESPF